MKLLLNKREAAYALSINESTLNRWAKDGKINQTFIGSRVLYKASDLELFVKRITDGAFIEKKRGRPRRLSENRNRSEGKSF